MKCFLIIFNWRTILINTWLNITKSNKYIYVLLIFIIIISTNKTCTFVAFKFVLNQKSNSLVSYLNINLGYRNTALKIDCFLYIKWRPLNPSLLRENTNCFSPIFYIRLRALQGEDRSPQRARIRKRKLSTLFIILFNNKSGVFQWSPKHYTRKHLFLPCEYTKL